MGGIPYRKSFMIKQIFFPSLVYWLLHFHKTFQIQRRFFFKFPNLLQPSWGKTGSMNDLSLLGLADKPDCSSVQVLKISKYLDIRTKLFHRYDPPYDMYVYVKYDLYWQEFLSSLRCCQSIYSDLSWCSKKITSLCRLSS